MALDLDRYVLQPCMAVWGSTVTFHGLTDPPLILRAVFDDRYREAKFDDLVGEIVSHRPMLGLRAAGFPPGCGPAQGRRRRPPERSAPPRDRRRGAAGGAVSMMQLASDIAAITVHVLKSQMTLAGKAVEEDRFDDVGSADMPRLFGRDGSHPLHLSIVAYLQDRTSQIVHS